MNKLAPSKKKGEKSQSVNFSHDLLSLLSAHDYLVIQALIWLHMVLFTAIQFDMKCFICEFTTSHVSAPNLREKPHPACE